MRNIQLALVGALIFAWPLNLFLKFAVNTAYVHGVFVDYLVPKLYLSDLIIGALFLVWAAALLRQSRRFNWQKWLPILGGGVLLSLISLRVSTVPIATSWYVFKLWEMTWLGYFLWQNRPVLQHEIITRIIGVTLLFQAGVGLLQFLLQRSVFPSYAWFGETRLETYAGIAKAIFNGMEKILPYGTTAHPNILGGILAMGILWAILQLQQEKIRVHQIFLIALILVSVATLALTQSIAAWLTLLVGILLLLTHHFAPQLLKPLAVFFISSIFWIPFGMATIAPQLAQDTSVSRRVTLNQAAAAMIQAHPWWGVGVNAFTANVETYLPRTEVTRFIQPVHHVALLILSEWGIVGSVMFFWGVATICRRYHYEKEIIFLLALGAPLLSLDHYLFTNQVGLLLLVLSFSLARPLLHDSINM